MPSTCAAMGAYAKVLVEPGAAPRVFDVNSERNDFIAETMTAVRYFQGRRLITGSLSQYASAIRRHSYMVQGVLVAQVGASQLHQWLPRAMWTPTPFTTNYTMGDDPTNHEFDMLIYRDNGIFRYNNCLVNRLVLRGMNEEGRQPGNEELIEMIVSIFAKTETINGEAWPNPEPALNTGVEWSPYNQWEGSFEFNGNDTKFNRFELSIDNRLKPIFNNSETAQCFRSQGRSVMLQTDNPFTAATLTDAVAALNAGVVGTLAFDHENDESISTTFFFPHLRNNYRSPTVQGKGEVRLDLNLEAFHTGAAQELLVVNDNTPI